MRVLSLFDGISCGRVALERAGIKVDKYFAYEIEPNAIKISEHNYPDIIRYGDVSNADWNEYKGEVDMIIAGFPCQDLSISKRGREGLNGKRSGLFYVLAEAIKTIQPKYFLVENNYNMPDEAKAVITDELKVEPILIDSSLLSAQRRLRYYWTNIPNVVLPNDLRISVKDIIDPEAKEKNIIQDVKFNGKETDTSYSNGLRKIGIVGKGGQGERVYSIYGKSCNLTANGGGRGAKTGLYLINGEVRKLSPLEAERLQTLPDNYTKVESISNTKRLKAVGNGWTVNVIAHIFSFLPGSYKI